MHWVHIAHHISILNWIDPISLFLNAFCSIIFVPIEFHNFQYYFSSCWCLLVFCSRQWKYNFVHSKENRKLTQNNKNTPSNICTLFFLFTSQLSSPRFVHFSCFLLVFFIHISHILREWSYFCELTFTTHVNNLPIWKMRKALNRKQKGNSFRINLNDLNQRLLDLHAEYKKRGKI